MPREPVVDFLGHIGLVYVMFMAGLEIDLRTARAHARETVTFGLLAFGASLGPTVALGLLLLGYDLPAALLLGALISSHTLLAYPVVERLGLLDRVPVVTAVGGTLITDTLALVLLAVVMSVAGGGAFGWVRPLGLLAALVALAAWGVPRLARAFFRSDAVRRAEKALFALVVLLVLSSAAELIGTDEVLGAFLAGITLNGALGEREALREHFEFVGRMLFIPFFFIYTGMLLDLGDAFQGDVLALAGLLLGLVVVGKTAAAWLSGALFGVRPLDRALMVGLTLPQAAATLAVTITASEAGLLDTAVVDAVILVILVTCIAGPVLTSRVGRRLAREPGRPDAAERRRDAPGDAAGEERPPVRREV